MIDPEGAGSPPGAPSGRGAGARVALVVIAAIVSGAVSAGVTLGILHFESRTNPQTVDLGSNVRITEDSAIIQVADRAAPAVVTIVTGSPAAGSLAGGKVGSGFLTTSDGYLVTNAHVVANAGGLTVLLAGDSTRHDARLVDSDCQTDIAVLKVDGVSNLPTLAFGDTSTLRVGQSVVVVGTPLGGQVVQAGIIAALHRAITVAGPVSPTAPLTIADTMQTDAVSDPAISGAPVLNVAGQVVGVAVETTAEGRPVGFALSAQDVQAEVEQIVRDGRLTVPTLGMVSGQVTTTDAVLEGTSPGAAVISVTPGGPAGTAGVLPGDIVTAVDEVKLDDGHPLQQVLISQFRQGQRVTLTLDRKGGTTQVQATLGGGHPECG